MAGKFSDTALPGTETGWSAAQLADEDYKFLCRLIYERSRISLSADKKVLVASRLTKRLRHLQLASYGEYCQLLRSPAGEEELIFLIDRISTNHTHFFREMKHFDFLREKVFPAWRTKSGTPDGPFRVWSAASSTGEEPYSLAIHLAEYFAPAETNAWQIEASDISTRVLEIAERGVYDFDKLGGINPEMLRRHFQKGVREHEGQYRVKDSLRRRVRYHHLNLLEPPYPFSQLFHVILCRNVMIYFDRPTQEALVNHLAERLMPGGYLLVGHSESLNAIKHSLQLVQPAIYLKAKP
jgi:chemotaxis protein methyltransferase CheR